MDSKCLESFLIPEEIATEGIGMEIAKLAGKGALAILKSIGIFLGLNVALVGGLMLYSDAADKKFRKRYEYPTPEEKKSRENYSKYWIPKFKEFYQMIIKDIDTVDKKCGIKKYLDTDLIILNGNVSGRGYYMYSARLFGIDWNKVASIDEDGDLNPDDYDYDKVAEFLPMLKELKPYCNKWKAEAKKFEPYVKLEINIDCGQNNNELYECDIRLVCKWVDKDGILKPGLPELK